MKATFAFIALFLLLLFALTLDATRELGDGEFSHEAKFYQEKEKPLSFEKFEPEPNFIYLPIYTSDVSNDVKVKFSFEKFKPEPNFIYYPKYTSDVSNDKREKANSENNILRLRSMDADKSQKDISLNLQDHGKSSFVVFFTINDLKVGKQWPMYLAPLSNYSSRLLSKKEAESIPFSYKQLPYLLKFFNYSAESPQGKAIEVALRHCEEESLTGEVRFCATSFEAMLDFVRSMFGSDTKFKAIASIHLTRSKTIVQNYTIIREPEEIITPKRVGCHPVSYPYKIFHCHSQSDTRNFKVSLVGENEDRIEAIAVCHMDTSEWSGDHRAFREIGSKPGLTDVCHFLPVNHIMWMPTQLP